jgi:hypothetical protein
MKLVRTLSIALTLALGSGVALADTKPAAKPAPAKDASKDKAAPAPSGSSDVNKADVDKFLAFFDKIVDAVVADKDNCPKMATDINALIDANQDLLAMANKAQAEGKKLPKDAEQHMMQSAQKMGPAMQKCQSDKAVQSAFMRMASGGKGSSGGGSGSGAKSK